MGGRIRFAAGSDFANALGEIRQVSVEFRTRAQFEGLLEDHPSHRFRQLIWFRHADAADEDGNDRNAALECELDLDPYEIGGVVESACPIGALRVEPVFSNDCDKDTASPDLHGELVAEIDTKRNGIHVLEDLIGSKATAEIAVDIVRRHCGIAAAVGKEHPDATHFFPFTEEEKEPHCGGNRNGGTDEKPRAEGRCRRWRGYQAEEALADLLIPGGGENLPDFQPRFFLLISGGCGHGGRAAGAGEQDGDGIVGNA